MEEPKKKKEECYFYVEDNRIWPMCLKCHDEKYPIGWYWNGGFGHQFDVVCHKCNFIIRKFNAEN